MRWWVVAAALLVGGCFGPQFESGQLRCEDGFCPKGLRCEDDLCVGTPETDDLDAATITADASADASADAAVVPQILCYGETPTRVVIGQVHAGDTMVAGFDNADGCNARGPEHYYELVLTADLLPADVTFDVQALGGYDPVLRVRQAICDDEQAEFVCIDRVDSETETRMINVPGSYFILVDSHGFSDGGGYELTVTLD